MEKERKRERTKLACPDSRSGNSGQPYITPLETLQKTGSNNVGTHHKVWSGDALPGRLCEVDGGPRFCAHSTVGVRILLVVADWRIADSALVWFILLNGFLRLNRTVYTFLFARTRLDESNLASEKLVEDVGFTRFRATTARYGALPSKRDRGHFSSKHLDFGNAFTTLVQDRPGLHESHFSGDSRYLVIGVDVLK